MAITDSSTLGERRYRRRFEFKHHLPRLGVYDWIPVDAPVPNDAVVVLGYAADQDPAAGDGAPDYFWFLNNIRLENDGRFSGTLVWYLPWLDEEFGWPTGRIFFEKRNIMKLLYTTGAEFYHEDDEPWQRGGRSDGGSMDGEET